MSVQAENAIERSSREDCPNTRPINRATSPQFGPDDSDVEALDEDFFANNQRYPARMTSPHPAQDAQTDLSSSWLSLSDPGTSTSGFPSSDDRDAGPAVPEPESPEGLSLRLSSSWIDAEARTTSEQLSPSEANGPGGDNREDVNSTDQEEVGGRQYDASGSAVIDMGMSSIEKVKAWSNLRSPDQHNVDLVFPTLDTLDESMQGTNSCDTIKNKTRFNRSASESTVKLMNNSTDRSVDVHQSFLSDFADPEGSSKHSLGLDLDLDLERVSDQQSVLSGCQDFHDGAANRTVKRRDEALGKYWMEEVGKRAVTQPEARVWADALAANRRIEESVKLRRRHDRMKGIAFLVLPFVALGIVALLTSPSIGAILSTTSSSSRSTSSHTAGFTADEVFTRRPAGPATVGLEKECSSETRSTGASLVLIPNHVPSVMFDKKYPTLANETAATRDVPLTTNITDRGNPMGNRIERFASAQLLQSSMTIAVWSSQQFEAGLHAVQAAIHRASVALIGTLAAAPKGFAFARARIDRLLAPAWQRTTSLVMADGKDIYRSALLDAHRAMKTCRDSLSVAQTRAIKDAKDVGVAMVDLLSRGSGRVDYAREALRLRAWGTLRSAQEISLSLPRGIKTSLHRPSVMVIDKTRKMSQSLQSRVTRLSGLVEGRARRLGRARSGDETRRQRGSGDAQPRQRRVQPFLRRRQRGTGVGKPR